MAVSLTGRSTERHLVVFAKAPIVGRVKRRLAADIGSVPAWAFYRRTLQTILKRVGTDPRWQTWIAIAPDRMAGVGRWWPCGLPRFPQGQGDLGRRMDRALRHPPRGSVVLIGADIPDLRPSHIAEAFRLLADHDLVFGPAGDGGFWLVGARRHPCFPYAFKTVRWSTPRALTDVLDGLDRRQRVAFAATLQDIDDGAALARWRGDG